jgi:hypothetical protein
MEATRRHFCHLRFDCRRPNTFLITYLNQRYAICRDIPAKDVSGSSGYGGPSVAEGRLVNGLIIDGDTALLLSEVRD